MKIMNLLPMDITYAPDGDMSKAIIIPKSGLVARLTQGEATENEIDTEFGTLKVLSQPVLGELYVIPLDDEDVPSSRSPFFTWEPDGENIYLVNVVVAQKLAGRYDVFSPASGSHGVIREDGKIIAVTHFNQFV